MNAEASFHYVTWAAKHGVAWKMQKHLVLIRGAPAQLGHHLFS